MTSSKKTKDKKILYTCIKCKKEINIIYDNKCEKCNLKKK